jgi:hypothetical protein
MTRYTRFAGLAFGVLAAWSTTAAPARADDWDQRTLVTFNRPVAFPGMALGKGTYRFEVPDTNNRQIVRVSNASGTQVYGTFLTLPAYRTQAVDRTVVTFKEASPRNPTPVGSWFYPGRQDGHVFLYAAATVKKPGVKKVVTRSRGRAPAPPARRQAS